MSLAFSHTIKRNNKTIIPEHFICFDVESKILEDKENNIIKFKPFLISAIYFRYNTNSNISHYEEKIFKSPKNFIKWITSKSYNKTNLYICSHNLVVDVIPIDLFTLLKQQKYKIDKIISHNRVLILIFTKDSKKLIFFNSGNLFSGSIEQWGKIVGLPKLKMPDNYNNMKQWEKYCLQDTKILYHMLKSYLDFLTNNDLGEFKLTIASQALSTFRHRFMKHEIAIHNHEKSLTLERNSYHGGRFQAIQIGKFNNDTYYKLDINSMYAYIMLNNSFPTHLMLYKSKCTINTLITLMNKYKVISKVLIHTKLPVFPLKINGKNEFVCGTFITYLTTPEIEFALQNNMLLHVFETSCYKHDYIFKDYIKFFVEKREYYKKQNNPVYEQMCKLFNNSLYGKFGQRNYTENFIDYTKDKSLKYFEIIDITNNLKRKFIQYEGKVKELLINDNYKYRNVAIASHITAYGRIMLFNLMQLAKFRNILHVATDSLLVNSKGYRNLKKYINNNKIGYLKNDGEYSNIIIYDTNDTEYEGKLKTKGISKNAKQIAENEFVIQYWTKFDSLLHRNNLKEYYIKNVKKKLKRPLYQIWLKQNTPNKPLHIYEKYKKDLMKQNVW